MRNYFLSISTIIVLLLSSCSNDEVNISDSPTLNKEKLDYSDERGKMMYNIIISMKTVNNPLEIQEKLMLLEEKSIKTNYRINNNVEFTETEIEIYGELLNNFNSTSFNNFVNLNNDLKSRINSEVNDDSKRELLLNDLSSYEWIKVAIEETENNNLFVITDGFTYETYGNPVPGSRESSDSYIDRCMENYINENFTWANWVDRILTIAEGPAGLLKAFVSCEYTYYFDNPHKK